MVTDWETSRRIFTLQHDTLRLLQMYCDDNIGRFYGGKAAVQAHQAALYYTCPEDHGHHHINFLKAGADDIAALYKACRPATFSRDGNVVLDDTCHKARRLDLGTFATLFDPRTVGMHDRISRGLLLAPQNEIELDGLSIYGEGDFSKAHKVTPRKEGVIGSLIVVLPTRHEGGQLVLRQCTKEDTQEWTLDFADTFATATEPTVCFISFSGEVEHEVLPVTSGYLTTLTYDLYHKLPHPSTSYIPTPFHERFRRALIEFINDKSILPEGGHLSCGLVHEYADNKDPVEDQLKGLDQILAMICKELDLQHWPTLLYNMLDGEVNLISQGGYALPVGRYGHWQESYLLEHVLQDLSTDDIVGVEIVGHPFHRDRFENGELSFVLPFYGDPVPKVLQIRPISSTEIVTPWASDRDEGKLEYLHGQVCMVIAIDPAATRKELVL